MENEKLVALVSAAQRGEENAATELYNAFQKDLYYHIYKTVNDTHLAEDLLQDTFIEIIQTIGNLKEPAAFLSWSRQIAYHRCTAYFKKRREILADEKEDGFSVFDTIEEENSEFIPDEALDKEELKQTIHNMINQLPEDQRSALLLRYFDEISVKEIAEIQGVTEGTVKSRLNYGRKAVKQAVEDYEKKNGIKLRCAGVIPLLLWLFREFAVSKGVSITAKTAAQTYTAANVASKAATVGVKTGVKAAGKFAVKKLVAGIIAATVTTASVATAVVLYKPDAKLDPEPDAAPSSTVQGSSEHPTKTPNSNNAVTEMIDEPLEWVGYGVEGYTYKRRFEFSLQQFDDASISGHLEVSYLYEVKHDSDFTGTGEKVDGKTVYTIKFETPVVVGTIPQYEYDELEVIYDKQNDTFSFTKVYDVEMERVSTAKVAPIVENESWSGIGKDGFYKAGKTENHQFELNVYQMFTTEISGNFTLTYDGVIDHKSEFVGRGYKDKGVIYYEILLETPRTQGTMLGEVTEDRFRLEYNIEKQTFQIPAGEKYTVTMEKTG